MATQMKTFLILHQCPEGIKVISKKADGVAACWRFNKALDWQATTSRTIIVILGYTSSLRPTAHQLFRYFREENEKKMTPTSKSHPSTSPQTFFSSCTKVVGFESTHAIRIPEKSQYKGCRDLTTSYSSPRNSFYMSRDKLIDKTPRNAVYTENRSGGWDEKVNDKKNVRGRFWVKKHEHRRGKPTSCSSSFSLNRPGNFFFIPFFSFVLFLSQPS